MLLRKYQKLVFDVSFVVEAGVSHDSLFFNQFSWLGFGISPGLKRPAFIIDRH